MTKKVLISFEEIELLISDYRHQVYSNGLLWDSLDEELEDMQALEDAAYAKLLDAIKQYGAKNDN